MKLHCFCRASCLFFMSVLLAACATTVNIDYREGYDFSSIRSVRLMVLEPASSDTRINSPLVDERVRKAITEHLASRGIAVVDENADAVVAYQTGSRSGVESYDTGLSVGYGRFSNHAAYGVGYGFPAYEVESYDEIVLTIDFLAPQDNTLLWRGSDRERLENGSTPEKMTALVNELVSDILVNYPPAGK